MAFESPAAGPCHTLPPKVVMYTLAASYGSSAHHNDALPEQTRAELHYARGLRRGLQRRNAVSSRLVQALRVEDVKEVRLDPQPDILGEPEALEQRRILTEAERPQEVLVPVRIQVGIQSGLRHGTVLQRDKYGIRVVVVKEWVGLAAAVGWNGDERRGDRPVIRWNPANARAYTRRIDAVDQ